MPVETHCHNDLGLAVANSVSGALGDLEAGQDVWINTCVNGIGGRSGNADLLSTILALRHGFGLRERGVEIGDPIDLSWARRFALWASYAFGQPLPYNQVGVGRNAFAHESGIHADGALKDHGNYELYDEVTLGPFPDDWHKLVQLCNAQTGRPLTDDELRLIAGYPRELSLLFPGQLG
ncbi:hypothetical protein [Actinomadura geliboluensis]|uniref:homocitrate synthase/isopropylmalate synthase family protein n=1 Tax=Actinomadura geliboluensis TaxID=882440 RepID=UPI001F109805|nr:hypothetical protein [Actinomadura geliboluensis]